MHRSTKGCSHTTKKTAIVDYFRKRRLKPVPVAAARPARFPPDCRFVPEDGDTFLAVRDCAAFLAAATVFSPSDDPRARRPRSRNWVTVSRKVTGSLCVGVLGPLDGPFPFRRNLPTRESTLLLIGEASDRFCKRVFGLVPKCAALRRATAGEVAVAERPSKAGLMPSRLLLSTNLRSALRCTIVPTSIASKSRIDNRCMALPSTLSRSRSSAKQAVELVDSTSFFTSATVSDTSGRGFLDREFERASKNPKVLLACIARSGQRQEFCVSHSTCSWRSARCDRRGRSQTITDRGHRLVRVSCVNILKQLFYVRGGSFRDQCRLSANKRAQVP